MEIIGNQTNLKTVFYDHHSTWYLLWTNRDMQRWDTSNRNGAWSQEGTCVEIPKESRDGDLLSSATWDLDWNPVSKWSVAIAAIVVRQSQTGFQPSKKQCLAARIWAWIKLPWRAAPQNGIIHMSVLLKRTLSNQSVSTQAGIRGSCYHLGNNGKLWTLREQAQFTCVFKASDGPWTHRISIHLKHFARHYIYIILDPNLPSSTLF